MSYQTLSDEEVSAIKDIILFLGKEYALRNWVMPIILGIKKRIN